MHLGEPGTFPFQGALVQFLSFLKFVSASLKKEQYVKVTEKLLVLKYSMFCLKKLFLNLLTDLLDLLLATKQWR